MNRCLLLAANGLGTTSPNPMVGCVIVYNNTIIGEGYHIKSGGPHAEVHAINSVKNKELLKQATLYVNLEPCAHWGKTPPCANLIVQNQIPNVIIGSLDPFEKVAGKGIEILKNAGINVITGILNNECARLNKRFFCFHKNKRPYIVLKWAQTADGYIDLIRENTAHAHPNWITSEISRTLVHKWRSEEDAIMVGTNTIEKDNPKLNVRNWSGNNPVRILIDNNLRLSNSYAIFDDTVPTLIFTLLNPTEKTDISQYKNTKFIQINFDEKITTQILNYLYINNLQSIIIEGGAVLHKSFIDENLWDEARIFIGNQLFFSGVKAAKLPASQTEVYKSGTDNLIICYNNNVY